MYEHDEPTMEDRADEAMSELKEMWHEKADEAGPELDGPRDEFGERIDTTPDLEEELVDPYDDRYLA